ncbi:hypothetical protein LCGC14_1854630 [marine sediment metagenome]|uniref:Uncharacterized protein n=1 Tax=marine sediment metagenome TaxID=412755 RepID=A0A0F9G9S9_9ZZZZ
MEDNINNTKLGEDSIDHAKKYIKKWRNEWFIDNNTIIDDFVTAFGNIKELFQRWKSKGIILDPDYIGTVGDVYAHFCTYDEVVALEEGFEEERLKLEEWDSDPEKDIYHFEVNKYISLKLSFGQTVISVDGVRFDQCRYVLLVDPLRNEDQGEIGSIDEAQAMYNNDLEEEITPEELGITREQEFWAHCSNLQAWYENNYDTRLLHSNISFPLLKKLTEVGDVKAKKVFKDEVGKRFVSGYVPVMAYLFKEEYLDCLTPEEFSTLLDEIDYSILNLNELLIYFKDFLFWEHSLQFLIRIKAEFKDYFSKNPIYIDFAEFILDRSEFCPIGITPDNKYFVRGSNDGKLKEFDIFTGNIKRVFGDHETAVSVLTVSNDGAYVASSCDTTIKVWDYASGDHVYTLAGHRDSVKCLQFDPQGRYLVSGSIDCEVKIWDLESGTLKTSLGSHMDEILSLDHSRDGRYLVSSACDTTINLWDTESSHLITTLVDRDECTLQIAISCLNDFILGSSYSTLKKWDLETNKIEQTIRVDHEKYDLNSFVLTPDSKFVVGILQGQPLEKGGKFSMWRISDGKLIYTLPIKQSFREDFQEMKNLSISQNGVFIVGGARDKLVKLWVDFLTYIEAEKVIKFPT